MPSHLHKEYWGCILHQYFSWCPHKAKSGGFYIEIWFWASSWYTKPSRPSWSLSLVDKEATVKTEEENFYFRKQNWLLTVANQKETFQPYFPVCSLLCCSNWSNLERSSTEKLSGVKKVVTSINTKWWLTAGFAISAQGWEANYFLKYFLNIFPDICHAGLSSLELW